MLNRSSTLNKVFRKIYSLFFYFAYRNQFGKITKRTTIYKPDILDGTNNIYLGEHVYIGHRAWMKCFKSAEINVGDGTYIGRDLHIISLSYINICKDVLIADRVYISDNIHEYKDINIPIIKQNVILKNDRKVILNDGCWIGENVCIIGCSIGRNSVVSANSVVLNDVPDFTIVAGNPAVAIKVYDEINRVWVKVK